MKHKTLIYWQSVASTETARQIAVHAYVTVKGNSFMSLVDSGSPISLMSESATKKLGLKIDQDGPTMTIVGVGGQQAPPTKEQYGMSRSE